MRAVPAGVQLETVSDQALGARAQPEVHVRDVLKGVQRPQ